MRDKRADQGERGIAVLAAQQHGVVSLAQLAAAGFDRDAVVRRVAAGRLHRLHRGVYAVGHTALSHRGRWMAAALAGGADAAVSHADATYVWNLLPPPAHPGPVHITVRGDGGRRRRDGLVVHRSSTLKPTDVTPRHGIPVTKPARTLADLRRVLPAEQVRDAIDRARFLGLPVGDQGKSAPTRSRLERRFIALCRRHRLPPPEVNVWVGVDRVDFLWRAERVVVETDGYETHRTRAAFEADRARDARLKLLGYEVARFTYRQVTEESKRVAAIVSYLLARSRPRPA